MCNQLGETKKMCSALEFSMLKDCTSWIIGEMEIIDLSNLGCFHIYRQHLDYILFHYLTSRLW